MDLTGCEMLTYDGVGRKKLKGRFSVEELATLFIEEWIPYTECRRSCGRSDYCKYVEPYPDCPDRLKDIKCGVAVEAMRNFVRGTFRLLKGLRRPKIPHYLDGAFYLCRVVHGAEQAIGLCVNEEVVRWFGESAPSIYGHIARLRKEWDSLNRALRHISDFYSQTRVLFVEGKSEKLFVERLGKPGVQLLPDLEIEVYGGKGNRRPKVIKMLLDNYVHKGYKVYIEGDADGKNTDTFLSLVKNSKVDGGHTFQFSHDFETGVPPPLLLASLKHLGHLRDVTLEAFTEAVGASQGSVLPIIKQKFGLDIEPIKLRLAKAVAETLNARLRKCLHSTRFMQTELGKFIQFVRKARWPD